LYERRLRAAGKITDGEIDAIDDELVDTMADAVAFAEASPQPRVESRFEDVLAAIPVEKMASSPPYSSALEPAGRDGIIGK
jgi:TPP-dependent pyruvate/acetoin dehydrogenase alpha subunit